MIDRLLRRYYQWRCPLCCCGQVRVAPGCRHELDGISQHLPPSTYEPQPGQIDLPEKPTSFREANGTTLGWLLYTTVTVINTDTSEQAKTVEAKRDLIASAMVYAPIVAVWPGGCSTDLFILRDRQAALEALGLRRKISEPRIVDADGNEWVTT